MPRNTVIAPTFGVRAQKLSETRTPTDGLWPP